MDKHLEEIWTDLHKELKRFISHKIKDTHSSEDILQNVFLKIQLHLHTLSDSAKLTSWVYQITRNAVVDHYRKMKPEMVLDGFDFAEQENEEPLYLSLSTCINQKIDKLPEEYKQAILLTYFNNYSQIALAEKLQLSYSGTKTRVQRGREKLKDLLSGCEHIPPDQKADMGLDQKVSK